jgi:glutaredoxin 3
MPNIEIYATGICGYCARARMLLDKKGVSYKEIRVDQQPELWSEMTQRSGRNTVPQIFIDDHHVGGFDDLIELDMDDELDPLLGLEEPPQMQDKA